MNNNNYLFKSERLGFRNWLPEDITPMSEINADPRVMEFFPSIQSAAQTIEFIERMQNQFKEKGFCYFAVDKLENGEFIGFIGISEQTFEADFTPCIDIGWRLSSKEWNKGFATEGAKRCLEYAFDELNIETINSMCPKINWPSENVMKKIGMKKVSEFKHPKLLNDERLQDCVLYVRGKITDYGITNYQ
jgi:RimJ/RimL family protein N-acetyltransferase